MNTTKFCDGLFELLVEGIGERCEVSPIKMLSGNISNLTTREEIAAICEILIQNLVGISHVMIPPNMYNYPLQTEYELDLPNYTDNPEEN